MNLLPDGSGIQPTLDVDALPDSVTLSSVLSLTPLGGPGPVLGVGPGDAPIRDRWEDGHLLIAGGRGTGATTILRTLAAQWASTGIEVDILDVTAQHGWAIGLERIQLHTNAGAARARLTRLAADVAAVPTQDALVRRVVIIDGHRTVTALKSTANTPAPGGPSERDFADLEVVLASGRIHGLRVVMAEWGFSGVVPNLPPNIRRRFPTQIDALPGATRLAAIASDASQVTRLSTDHGFRPGRMLLTTPNREPVLFQTVFLQDEEAGALADAADEAEVALLFDTPIAG